MDVWRITLAALRRWYVLVPLLALTGLVVVLAGSRVAPEYEAQTSVMVTPERVPPQIANPYDTITSANSALNIVLNSVESRRAVQDQGLSASYEVAAQSRSTILQITIRADTAAVAEQTGAVVIGLAEQELATRQTEAGLAPDAQYTVSVLEPPAVIAIVYTGKLRIQAIVGVLGAGLSLLIAVLFDDIVGLWRRAQQKRRSPIRRQTKVETTPTETETTPAETETQQPETTPPTITTAIRTTPVELPRRRPTWVQPQSLSVQPKSLPEDSRADSPADAETPAARPQ